MDFINFQTSFKIHSDVPKSDTKWGFQIPFNDKGVFMLGNSRPSWLQHPTPNRKILLRILHVIRCNISCGEVHFLTYSNQKVKVINVHLNLERTDPWP